MEDGQDTDILSADTNAENAIKNDPSRATYFWKLILPEGFELDNMSLSGSHWEIDMNTYIHTDTIKKGSKKWLFNTMFAEWEVAKQGSGIKVATNGANEEEEDLDNMFVNK